MSSTGAVPSVKPHIRLHYSPRPGNSNCHIPGWRAVVGHYVSFWYSTARAALEQVAR